MQLWWGGCSHRQFLFGHRKSVELLFYPRQLSHPSTKPTWGAAVLFFCCLCRSHHVLFIRFLLQLTAGQYRGRTGCLRPAAQLHGDPGALNARGRSAPGQQHLWSVSFFYFYFLLHKKICKLKKKPHTQKTNAPSLVPLETYFSPETPMFHFGSSYLLAPVFH